MKEKIKNFLNLFAQNECKICGKFSKKFGFCFEHLELEKIKNDFKEILIEARKDGKNSLILIKEIHETTLKIKFKLYTINNELCDIADNYKFYWERFVGEKIKNDFKMTFDNIKYKKIIKYVKTLENNMCEYFGENIIDNEVLKNYKLYGLERRMLMFNLKFFNNFTNAKMAIDTNAIFIRDFIEDESDIDDNMIYIKEEYPITVNNKNFRYDIFIILRSIKNKLLRVCIEIDENAHFSNTFDDSHDRIKDLYCFEHGISLCRYYCKTRCVTPNDIKNVKRFLKTIVYANFPQYYFSEKYLSHKKEIGINVTLNDINDIEVKERVHERISELAAPHCSNTE